MEPRKIKEVIEYITGIKDIAIKSRLTPYADARTIYARICVESIFQTTTLEKIGAAINRDHSNIIHLDKKAFIKKQDIKSFKELYLKCSERVSELLQIEEDQKNLDFDPLKFLNDSEEVQENRLTELREKLEAQIIKQKEEVKRLKSSLSHKIIGEILELDPEQFEMFETRASVMINNVKKIRTYKNTNRADFNAA